MKPTTPRLMRTILALAWIAATAVIAACAADGRSIRDPAARPDGDTAGTAEVQRPAEATGRTRFSDFRLNPSPATGLRLRHGAPLGSSLRRPEMVADSGIRDTLTRLADGSSLTLRDDGSEGDEIAVPATVHPFNDLAPALRLCSTLRRAALGCNSTVVRD